MDILFATLRDALALHAGGVRFLLDGFPRSMEQISAFERIWGPPEAVLSFKCDEATMRARVLARGRDSGRADDTEAVVMRRFVTFLKQTAPVVAHFTAAGVAPTVHIDARGTVEGVYAQARACGTRGERRA